MTISNLYKLFLECDTVSTDTRSIGQNSMFFALKGENFNGNLFAKDALEHGAKYAVVDEEVFATNNNIFLTKIY